MRRFAEDDKPEKRRVGATATRLEAGTSKAGTSEAGTSEAGTSKAGTSKAATSKAGTRSAQDDTQVWESGTGSDHLILENTVYCGWLMQ
jgi:hypothetical protein